MACEVIRRPREGRRFYMDIGLEINLDALFSYL
jgi:hypothetical protein